MSHNTTGSNRNVPGSQERSKAYASQSRGKKLTHPYNWVKYLRALPSKPSAHDYLKPEYIEVNLNNSRKLIKNLDELTGDMQKSIEVFYGVNESLLRVQKVKQQLEWLEDL